VQILTGGNPLEMAGSPRAKRVTTLGRSGAKPEPTVTVRMKESMVLARSASFFA